MTEDCIPDIYFQIAAQFFLIEVMSGSTLLHSYCFKHVPIFQVLSEDKSINDYKMLRYNNDKGHKSAQKGN